MTVVARLDMDIRAPGMGDDDPRVQRVDCYALPDTDLSGYAGLVAGPSTDQEFLAAHRDVIARYLDGGGVVVFGGHLHRDWLPGAAPFVPLATRTLAGYRVAAVADHPLFAGLTADDLTFRRGVAGFFARGHHPPPPGAQVLTRLAGGQPATYLDRVSTAGTILVHATADLAGHVGTRLVDWILSEASAPHRGSPRRPEAHHPAARAAGAAPPPPPAPPFTGHGIAAVYSGSAPHHRALTTPKYARHLDGGLVYLPDLAGTDLTGLDTLVVPERMHRGLLTGAAERVLALLEAGGTVVAFSGGEPIPEFLPGVRWEHRPTNFWWWLEPGAGLGLRSPSPRHPFFDHLTVRDCTWHYHGALDPPPGADVLVTLPGGEALLYVDRVSTPGTLVVSTLDPLSHFGGYFMPATERFLDGFLPWLAAGRLAA